MKRNKILTLIAGIAILFSISCSGIILAQGIRTGTIQTTPASKSNRCPNAWELKKTKLDEFSEISVSLSYCSFSILPSDSYALEYRMDGTCEKPEYDISEGSFHFREGHTQEKYRTGFHLFFNPANSAANQGPFYVNLYVPKEAYFNLLSLSNESGNIQISDIQAEQAEIMADYGNLDIDGFSGKKLSINADSGNIDLGAVACDNLEISNEYGNIEADSLIIAKNTVLKLDSGNLNVAKLESDQLTLSNEYGNCTSDEITVKSSDISMESGVLKLRKATLGNTEINSSYGDTTLDLVDDVSDYNYDLKAEYGSVTLGGTKINANDDGEVYYQKDNGQENDIRIISESGNIKIH